MSVFLGIDFGWEGRPSGLAQIVLDGNTLTLADSRTETPQEAILEWVDHAGREAVGIGVDAPLVIPNETGMREADKLAHSCYGRYHAGCYPASRARSYWRRTTGFSDSLSKRGFVHAAARRFQIEVHPHAATVQFHALDRIVKYKRGILAARRAGLMRLRDLMLAGFPALDPPLKLKGLPEIPFNGRELKAVEDRLDAITCAYVAAYWWRWGRERNDVLGDSARGYIVVPKRKQL